ncbi:MAG TPA: hypothetical protein ENJ63_03280 [Dissulfuribacter thermophilus]|uniref:Uncharacterized protein n=1 Tax=Dissulfuribacter thermophilus TaxID=1156395 RepID=A0A7V2SYD6_9BACT|nr:hypothetical protein [Dissulfuribacter thermophilus]
MEGESNKVYVIEFKVDQPGKALKQIKAKGCHKKHLGTGRDVYLVGISFSSKNRKIEKVEWELIQSNENGTYTFRNLYGT